MSLLVNLIQAEIRDAKDEMDGKTLTRPTLSISDGQNMTFCVDVDIGQAAPLRNVPIARGNRELQYAEVGSAVRIRKSVSGLPQVVGFSKRRPGIYVEIPVTMPKFDFAPQAVYNGPTPVIEPATGVVVGVPRQVGFTSRVLSYDEFIAFGGYGVVPYGAVAIYENGIFKEILS